MPISRPVLSGSVCIVKTSDEQVCVWMVTQVQAVLQFLGLQVSLNDSFWAPATWGVALQSLTRLAGMRMACKDLLGDLGWFARPEVH